MQNECWISEHKWRNWSAATATELNLLSKICCDYCFPSTVQFCVLSRKFTDVSLSWGDENRMSHLELSAIIIGELSYKKKKIQVFLCIELHCVWFRLQLDFISLRKVFGRSALLFNSFLDSSACGCTNGEQLTDLKY